MPNVAGVEYPYTPEGIAAAQQAQSGLDPARFGQSAASALSPYASYSGLVGGGVPQSGRSILQNLQQQRQPTFESVSHRPEQPTFRDVSHRPTGGVSTLQDMLQLRALREMMQQGQSQAGIADQYQPQTSFGQFGNPAIQQPNLGDFGQSAAGALRPFQSQPTSNFGQLVGRAIGGLPGQAGGYNPGIMQGQATQFGQSSWPPVQRPITQVPRGRTTNIGQTPSLRGQTIQTTPGAGYGSSPSGPTAQQPANYGQSPSNPNWKPPKP